MAVKYKFIWNMEDGKNYVDYVYIEEGSICQDYIEKVLSQKLYAAGTLNKYLVTSKITSVEFYLVVDKVGGGCT